MDVRHSLHRPWNFIPIKEGREPLHEIPSQIKRFIPHPYKSLGAPYGTNFDPWMLRTTVNKRLLGAQKCLQEKRPEYQLLVFDAWRPIEVQKFMFNRAFILECERLDIDASEKDMERYPIVKKNVEKFWAYPSFDERYPPPHSTGGALDITLADKYGNIINMGSNIDQMDDKSKPDFYNNIDNVDAIIWNDRRKLLKEIMIKFEFVQHPNEWWHFSYGDQLWAWKNKKTYALYGKI